MDIFNNHTTGQLIDEIKAIDMYFDEMNAHDDEEFLKSIADDLRHAAADLDLLRQELHERGYQFNTSTGQWHKCD